jgi:hypothetical protein
MVTRIGVTSASGTDRYCGSWESWKIEKLVAPANSASCAIALWPYGAQSHGATPRRHVDAAFEIAEQTEVCPWTGRDGIALGRLPANCRHTASPSKAAIETKGNLERRLHRQLQ